MVGAVPKPSVHGWLILDKPLGLTSTQALGKARRFVGGKKVGHMGTLDPLATGVLPLAFGEATKLIPYIQNGEKEYLFTVRWGLKRTTDDGEGEVTAQSPVRPKEEKIFMALRSFVGHILQTPPAYSAIKIDGKRAYALARGGKDPKMTPRPVDVYSFDLVKMIDADHASFRVVCGSGTYVRALARDLAESLGTYGYVTALQRTRVGLFSIESAISLEKLEELSHKQAAQTALLKVGSALDDILGLILTASDAGRLRAGQGLLLRPDQMDLMDAPILLASHRGTPVALVKAEGGVFRVVRGFNF